jgi:hypothetical protein
MGLPLPPRRFHGHEVFHSPACHGPKTAAPPPGLARFQEPPAKPVPDPKARDCPSWGCFRPFNDSAVRSASPRFASPGTFRPRGSSLLDGLLPDSRPRPRGDARRSWGSESRHLLRDRVSGVLPLPTLGSAVQCSRCRVRRKLAQARPTRHVCGARCAPSSSSEEPRGRVPLRHAVSRIVPWAGSRGPGGQEAVLTVR